MGRWTSVLSASSTGLLFMSKPTGISPPSSPANGGPSSRKANCRAESAESVTKHLRPMATPVTAMVVARMTSIATTE